MTLTKDKIVELIRSKTQFSSQEAKNLVETILECIKSKLENGEEVKICGFGKWVVIDKDSRPGRNPHTGQRIEISARRVVTFHPADKIRKAVNNAKLDDSQVVMAGTHEEDCNE